MQTTHNLNTWSWIPVTWLVLYPVVTVLNYATSVVLSQETLSIVMLAGFSIVVATATYRRLVGGGCTIRFRLCALVKGIIAGLIFVMLSLLADVAVWETTSVAVGWSPVGYGLLGTVPYYAWLVGALMGGFAARVVEVRGSARDVRQFTVSGFE